MMIHANDWIARYVEVFDHRGNPVDRLTAIDPQTGEAIQALPQFFDGWLRPFLRKLLKSTGEVPTRHFFLQKGFKVFLRANPETIELLQCLNYCTFSNAN